MRTFVRRSLPSCLTLLVALACSKAPAGTPRAASSGSPARQIASMPALVDSVDARPVARSVVLCKTTADELRRQLGEPTRDGVLHGSRIMSWTTTSQSPEVFLAILVDSRGVVADLYFDVPTEVPWVPTDQCARR